MATPPSSAQRFGLYDLFVVEFKYRYGARKLVAHDDEWLLGRAVLGLNKQNALGRHVARRLDEVEHATEPIGGGDVLNELWCSRVADFEQHDATVSLETNDQPILAKSFTEGDALGLGAFVVAAGVFEVWCPGDGAPVRIEKATVDFQYLCFNEIS